MSVTIKAAWIGVGGAIVVTLVSGIFHLFTQNNQATQSQNSSIQGNNNAPTIIQNSGVVNLGDSKNEDGKLTAGEVQVLSGWTIDFKSRSVWATPKNTTPTLVKLNVFNNTNFDAILSSISVNSIKINTIPASTSVKSTSYMISSKPISGTIKIREGRQISKAVLDSTDSYVTLQKGKSGQFWLKVFSEKLGLNSISIYVEFDIGGKKEVLKYENIEIAYFKVTREASGLERHHF